MSDPAAPVDAQRARLQALTSLVAREPTVAGALEQVGPDGTAALDLTAPGGAAPVPRRCPGAIARGRARHGRTAARVLVVTATGREAEEITAAAAACWATTRSPTIPAWETLPHERLSPRSDTVGRRLAVLRRLVHPARTGRRRPDQGRRRAGAVGAAAAGQGAGRPRAGRSCAPATTVDLEDVVRRLAAAAYHRVDLVERRGEFAVRGGIVDVFPPTEEHPLRVEFWGDDGRGDPVLRGRRPALARRGAERPVGAAVPRAAAHRRGPGAGRASWPREHPELREMLDKLAEGHAVEGMESLAPALVDDMELLVDLLPAGSIVLVCDPERVRARAHDLVATSQEFLQASWAAAAGGGEAPIDLGAAAYRTLGDVRTHALARGLPGGRCRPFGLDAEPPRSAAAPVAHRDRRARSSSTSTSAAPSRRRPLDVRAADAYRGDTERAVDDIARLARGRLAGRPVTEGHGPAQRAGRGARRARRRRRASSTSSTADPEPRRRRRRRRAASSTGSCAEAAGLVVLTDDDLAGQRADRQATRSRMPSPAPQADRPAGAARRRLRRARAARRRPLRRDGPAHGRTAPPASTS